MTYTEFVNEFYQNLVGGNSNIQAKLSAIVPGLFAATGEIGKTSRRLTGMALVLDEKAGEYIPLLTTLSKAGEQHWAIKKNASGRYDTFTYREEEHGSRLTDGSWKAYEVLKEVVEQSDLSEVAGEDEWWSAPWSDKEGWDVNIFDAAMTSDIPFGQDWKAAGYRLSPSGADSPWSFSLPNALTAKLRELYQQQQHEAANLEGGGATS